ncbi:MAG: hypothetical protein NTZ64_00320 [Polaromonas sp.]|nr:hypothetical protein [Polaromonas sp.]
MTIVSQIMTRGVRSMQASDNVMAAAQAMEELSEISFPSEPDRSHQSQASGAAGGGSASRKPRTRPD